MKYLAILAVMVCGCGMFPRYMEPAPEYVERWDRCESTILKLQCQNISRNYDVSSCHRKLMGDYVELVNGKATEEQKKTYLKHQGCPPWMVD